MATRRSRIPAAVGALLESYPLGVQDLAVRARQLILDTLSGIEETVDSSARLFGYGYGPGYSGVVCTLILSKSGAKLGLVRGCELADPEGLLAGSGKVHRHVVLSAITDVSNPAVKQLLVKAHAAWRLRRPFGAAASSKKSEARTRQRTRRSR